MAKKVPAPPVTYHIRSGSTTPSSGDDSDPDNVHSKHIQQDDETPKPILKPVAVKQQDQEGTANTDEQPVIVLRKKRGKHKQTPAQPLSVAAAAAAAHDYRRKKLEMQQEAETSREYEAPPRTTNNADNKPRKPKNNKLLKERFQEMRDRFQDVSDGLKCGICGSVFLDPVQIAHPDCMHVYCERCLEERTVHESLCPECGFVFGQNLVKQATAINNIIMDQIIPCFFEPAGCTEHIRFRDIEEHERRCSFNPDRIVECVCGEEMPISKHKPHLLDNCPDFLFDCPHGCGEKVKRRLLLTHEDNECVLKPVRCEFAKFGCTFKGPRADLYKHNKDHFQAHMGLMASRIQDLEAEGKKMHIQQRESQRQMELHQRRAAVGFERSYDTLVPDLDGGGRKQPSYTVSDAKMKKSGVPGSDVMLGASDRVLPKGLTVVNEHLRPKWSRMSTPKRIIESPKNGSYRFVRPYACAFVTDYTIAMTDCQSAWLIDVETGSVRSTLEPLTPTRGLLFRPRGVSVQETGLRVFVADSQSDSVHAFLPSGEYAYSFGKDKLKYPLGVATYHNRVFVCDSQHNTLQIFDSVGTHVGTLPEEYHGSPAMACSSDTSGLIYVTMNSTSDSYVLAIDHLGEFVTTFGVKGDDIGTLNKASGITVDEHENVFVGNGNQYKIQMFSKVATKTALRERRRWENKARDQVWQEEMEKGQSGEGDGTKTTVDNAGTNRTFEERVEERLKSRPHEMEMPEFEYRPVDWLGTDELCSPGGLAISPSKTMLAVVDEVKNKLYIY